MDAQQPHPLPEKKSGKFFQLNSELADRLFISLQEKQNETMKKIGTFELIMLDYNGTTFPLEHPEFSECMRKLLLHPKSKIRLITMDDTYILSRAPRFLKLRDIYNEKIDWRIARDQDPSKIQMSFAIINTKILIKKTVRDAYHGYQTDDIADIRGSIDYFEQIWQLSEYAPPSQPLGI
jgi:hypothetical protein